MTKEGSGGVSELTNEISPTIRTSNVGSSILLLLTAFGNKNGEDGNRTRMNKLTACDISHYATSPYGMILSPWKGAF